MKVAADGLVLAGGFSRRMGTNKSQLPYNASTTLVQHASDTLQTSISGTVWISRPFTWGTLGDSDLPDSVGNQGPLQGILAGLTRTDHEWMAVLAVDCPNVPPELFDILYGARGAKDQVLVPRCGNVSQPLAALWSKELASHIVRSLHAHQFKVQTLLNRIAAHYVLVPDPEWLVNLNTPQDWEHWIARTGANPR